MYIYTHTHTHIYIYIYIYLYILEDLAAVRHCKSGAESYEDSP